MQSQFTDKAKTALLLAGRAAKSLHQNYVGTEHILLGLIKEGTGVASRVLTENGAKEEAIREMIQDLLAPETPNPVIERDGYSPRAEEVLEESHRQAEKAGSVLTGTEHILLALLGDGDNVAVRVLQTLSLPLQKIMRDTLLAAGLDPTAYREELGRRQKKEPDRDAGALQPGSDEAGCTGKARSSCRARSGDWARDSDFKPQDEEQSVPGRRTRCRQNGDRRGTCAPDYGGQRAGYGKG